MFLSRGDRDLGVAFQTHPGRQAFISSGSKEARSALPISLGGLKGVKPPEALGERSRDWSLGHAGDLGLISGSGRFPGEGNGNPLQYSCLENSVNRGAWRATVHGVTKSRTRLSDLHTHTHTHRQTHTHTHTDTHTKWIRVGPKPVTTVLIRRGKFRHSHRREPQVLTEGEIGMMCLQVKECQGMPVITRS